MLHRRRWVWLNRAATGFDFPVQHSFDGTGHAVVIAGTVKDSDIKGFVISLEKHHGTKIIEGQWQWSPATGRRRSHVGRGNHGYFAPGAISIFTSPRIRSTSREDAYNAVVSDKSRRS